METMARSKERRLPSLFLCHLFLVLKVSSRHILSPYKVCFHRGVHLCTLYTLKYWIGKASDCAVQSSCHAQSASVNIKLHPSLLLGCQLSAAPLYHSALSNYI